MNKKGIMICAALLFLVGVGVLLYPTVSSFINKQIGSYAIQELRQEIGDRDAEEMEGERIRAQVYNASLLSNRETVTQKQYASILNFRDGMMGYIRIPKINIDLPIYHGVSDEVLAKGVGHMPESAFPIGGAGNHAVLTGHTGLPSADLFTDLIEMEEGDTFQVVVLEETITYQVDQIKVVLPGESQDLMPVAGEDLCTLVTCTPYGINSHRLLVRGKRIEHVQEAVQIPEVSESEAPPVGMVLLTVGLLLMFFITIILILRKKCFD